ncbi:MAG TPA: DUF1080 domain-containing protein [Bryobacteraceae bacterium]|nr:DUF1080 domain-containing protein [Bryobacteraceae bacterium]
MKQFFSLVLIACGCWAQSQPSGARPELAGKGWRPLLNSRDVSGWHPREGKPNSWLTATSVTTTMDGTRQLLAPAGGAGPSLVNGPDGRAADLISDEKFGDVELYLEFLITKKSNSGVYLQGLYELQILDSYGAEKLGVHDCGAVYERWIDGKGVGGNAPLTNASRPPGEWQSFHIWFRAPRFDGSGKKVKDAEFLKVEHNGKLVQKNVIAPGPTRASLDMPEAAHNPLMLQGDHGPVAFRNIYIRKLAGVK